MSDPSHLRLCEGDAYDYIIGVSLYRADERCTRINVLSSSSNICSVVNTSVCLSQSAFNSGDINTIVDVNSVISVNDSNCYSVIGAKLVDGLDNLLPSQVIPS